MATNELITEDNDPAVTESKIIETFLWIFIFIAGGAVKVMNKIMIASYVLTPIAFLTLLSTY